MSEEIGSDNPPEPERGSLSAISISYPSPVECAIFFFFLRYFHRIFPLLLILILIRHRVLKEDDGGGGGGDRGVEGEKVAGEVEGAKHSRGRSTGNCRILHIRDDNSFGVKIAAV